MTGILIEFFPDCGYDDLLETQAEMVEQVDTRDLKSLVRKDVRVQVPLSALINGRHVLIMEEIVSLLFAPLDTKLDTIATKGASPYGQAL